MQACLGMAILGVSSGVSILLCDVPDGTFNDKEPSNRSKSEIFVRRSRMEIVSGCGDKLRMFPILYAGGSLSAVFCAVVSRAALNQDKMARRVTGSAHIIAPSCPPAARCRLRDCAVGTLPACLAWTMGRCHMMALAEILMRVMPECAIIVR